MPINYSYHNYEENCTQLYINSSSRENSKCCMQIAPRKATMHMSNERSIRWTPTASMITFSIGVSTLPWYWDNVRHICSIHVTRHNQSVLSINITHIIFIIIIRNCKHSAPTNQAHEQVQAVADTSTRWHFAFGAMLSWQQTHAPTANLSNSAQLDSTPYHSRKLHTGPCSSAEMRRGTDIQTDTHTDGCDQYTFRLGYASHEM